MGKKKKGLLIGREYPPVEEMQYINAMIAGMERQLNELYEGGKMLRQAHPKMHGLVKAEFIVEHNLPEELRVGIFKEAKTYNAYIRLSNASSTVQPDKKMDIRGMAIKLLDVPGNKLLTDEPTNQDFMLISYHSFIARDVKQFSETVVSLTAGKASIIRYLLSPQHWGVLGRVLKAAKKCTNVLNISYWSTTPYQYGSLDKAVKYFASPANAQPFEAPATTGENFIRENLVHSLNNKDAYFDFHVQFQTDADAMPIEDATVKWESPFIKVATIKIPKQQFDTDEQNKLGEELSFSPWHALTAHRPLGGLNRARKAVYETMYAYRMKHNKND